MYIDPVAEFRSSLPFPLDPFQLDALLALSEGRSVLVAAPTGTGKTVVAEFAVHLALSRGLRALYTTPIKALSNQKFRDFRTRYADKVGLLTGDLVENPTGRLLVMTTEVARNMLVQDPSLFRDVGCLIFDEVHYLADPERGTAWEESILLAPPHVPLVCLSATVANAEEIAAWIRTTGRDVALIQSRERTVPLRHRYYLDGTLHASKEEGEEIIFALPRTRAVAAGVPAGPIGRLRRAGPGNTSRRKVGREIEPEASLPHPAEVVKALAGDDLLPSIYFLFGRKAVEEAAESCQRLRLLPHDQAVEVRRLARERLSDLPAEDRSLAQVERLLELLPKGIGFHHAGLLPPLKTLVEELLASGQLKVVFATDTLALGINVPARSVVVGELTKFDGHSRRLLSSGEYRQLTGRAGRRGMDPVGYSVLLYSPWVTLDRTLEIATGPVAPLESAFRPGYSTVLNLWREPEDEEQLASLIADSLRQFQQEGEIRSREEERERLLTMLDALPAGCPLDGGPVSWLLQDKRLRREYESAESALAAALKAGGRAQFTGKVSVATEARVLAARERLQIASRAMRKSPCRACALRADHRRSERERRNSTGLLAAVERDLEKARGETRGNAIQTLRSLRSVLECFGYLSAGRPAAKARVLMRLFDSNSLVISELLDWGALAGATAQEIAEVASWFAFDREGSGRALAITEQLARIRAAAEMVAKEVLEVERRFRVNLSSPLAPDFRGVALAWATGATLSDLSARSGLAEGDLVFMLQKTIDLCRQLAQAAAHSRTPSLARQALEAERLLRRGVVDSYYRWVVGPESLATSRGSA